VHEWLHVVEEANNKAAMHPTEEPMTVAVHCVAGLGRAPVLVAIALIELGMAPLDAIEYIRGKRRGAFNKPQITFLDGYRRKPTTNNNSFRTSLGRMLGFGPKQPTVSQQT
jgi:protein tyrosine phosphatase type 4A